MGMKLDTHLGWDQPWEPLLGLFGLAAGMYQDA